MNTGYEDPGDGNPALGDGRDGAGPETAAWPSQMGEAAAGNANMGRGGEPAGDWRDMESMREQSEVIGYLMRPRETTGTAGNQRSEGG